MPVLSDIGKKGDMIGDKYDWNLLMPFIIVKLKDALMTHAKKYDDFRKEKGETFEEVVSELAELLTTFESK